MLSRYYIRVHRRDGSLRCSPFFESLEEADRWRQTVRLDPVVLVAVIVEVESTTQDPDYAPTDAGS